MTTKEMVMQDSPEAASMRTVTGWVSRNGRFWGADERAARYDGCTHVACRHCGKPVEKGWTACEACRDMAKDAKYKAMPRKAWDGASMLFSHSRDEYFNDIDGAEAALDDGETLDDLRLVICEPNRGRRLDEDYFWDELSEDGELPDCLLLAIETFNAAIATAPPLSWSPGKFALDTTALTHNETAKGPA